MRKFLLLAGFVLSAAVAHAAATTEGRADLLPLGASAPAFQLPDVTTGQTVSLESFAGKKALVVVFVCRHCPYVQHVKKALATLAVEFQAKDVAFVAISANDPAAFPADAPESLAEMVREEGFVFPLLFDESQSTARAYTAVATPDTFIFNAERKLVYRGQFDGSRPKSGKIATGEDVRAALEALLAGQPVNAHQKPAVGCSIKWKS